MTFRVAIGGFEHETNQYVTALTTLDQFHVSRGDEIAGMRGTRTYLGGMLDAAHELGAEAVCTLAAIAIPWGAIEASAYRALKDELCDRIRAALPVDAVALALHGAAVAEGIEDVEADVCEAVRAVIGPAIPLVVTHDLHGHITQREADTADAMFGVHHYPHDDTYDRGREAIEILPDLIARRLAPVTVVERLPLLIPATTTYHGIGAEILELCQRWEKTPGIIDCTFMHGFPFTDNPLVGCHVVVIADGDHELARRVAQSVAAEIWAMRERFFEVVHPGADDAVRIASAHPNGPVVINETSDNPGGGTPGDGTHLLRALLAAKPENAVFCGIRDADVVTQAHAAGVGATIDIELGGKADPLHGEPIPCTAYVRTLADGVVTIEAAMNQGMRLSLGRTAGLVIDGVDVIVYTRSMQTIDRTPFLLHGIDVTTCHIVALKSSNHFRSGFESIAAAIVTADPPGLTTQNLDQLPRSRAPWPLYPLDGTASYPFS